MLNPSERPKVENTRPTKIQAIQKLLKQITHPDLVTLYTPEMEVQITVSKGGGEQIKQEFKGRPYVAFSDGVNTWKPFRIPWKAATNPEYKDTPMNYDLARHYEGIGMTGWNWAKRKSIYVAYDFDSITNHTQGLPDHELQQVFDLAMTVPWVTIRRSTSGSGYHLYVFLDDISTANHTEHAALSRAILAKLSSVVGHDFIAKVDTCGGNMWIAHRKMHYDGEDTVGLSLVKKGEILYEIPANWQSHIDVVSRKKSRIELPTESDDIQEIEDIVNQRVHVAIDDEHRALIKDLEGTDSWWDTDRHLLITHTWSLSNAFATGSYRGVFSTVATGTADGGDHNCFCIPLSKGAWLVYRYTKYCTETSSWTQTTGGWTTCFFNRNPDLKTAAQAYDAIETEKRGFLFQDAATILKALEVLGVYLDLPNYVLGREALFKENRDGRVIVKIKREDRDDAGKMSGWEAAKDKYWTRIFQATKKSQSEISNNLFEDMIRHLVQAGEDRGWAINNGGIWCTEPLAHVKLALSAQGFNDFEIKSVTGGNITHCWHLVCEPFKPEYPGGRRWNRKAPQLVFTPSGDIDNLNYPHWLAILNHCGSSLNEAITLDPWCKVNGLTTGSDYLKCWCASMIQQPSQPLPYLFLFGEQNTGKSIFHEALSLLFDPGYVRADIALENPSGFNGELENAVLCVIEETNLQSNKIAYNRIKDWVTSLKIPIHIKQKTPMMIQNTTHWIQCANDSSFCPIFPGDTRIVTIRVPTLKVIIPRQELIRRLLEEAPDFIAELLSLQLPKTNDRLNLPVLRTAEKNFLESSNRTELEVFLDEHCYWVPGTMLTFAEFYEAFIGTLEASEVMKWSKIRVGKNMPQDKFPKGRRSDGTWCFGNIAFEPIETEARKLIRAVDSEMLKEK